MLEAQTSSQPIITGILNDTLFQSEWFEQWSQAGAYQPDLSTYDKLKPLNYQEVSFKVYLGTWCEDSQVHVPAFLVLARLLNWKYELIGVNREKECPFDRKDCKQWDIVKLPTIVVNRNNAELGRMIETPTESIEKDLLRILQTP